jgi:hypothetical protein
VVISLKERVRLGKGEWMKCGITLPCVVITRGALPSTRGCGRKLEIGGELCSLGLKVLGNSLFRCIKIMSGYVVFI